MLSYDQLTFVFTPSSSSTSVLSFHLLLGFVLFVSVFSFWLTPGGLAWNLSKAQTRAKTAIPGPSGLPFLGMVLCFTSSQTHRVLSKLARCFHAESLMAFSVGLTRFVISSKPETAKEILNSPAFADRPVKESAYELLFHRAMGFAPYGEYWRGLRRLSATHLFSPKRIASLGGMRADIGKEMVKEITLRMEEKGEVEVRNVLHIGSLNNVMMSVFGKSYDQFWRNETAMNHDALELEYLVKEGYELLSIFNWGDHFPLMKWLDLQRVRKRGKRLLERVNIFVGNIIQEHRLKRARKSKSDEEDDDDDVQHSHDFVDVLLDLNGENRLDDSDMIAVLWEMIFRGTDTVTILLEWILARMILHPDIQSKAQEEIARVVGAHKTVSDSDLPKLSYLQAVVKETLRMHPPGPLLSWARLAIHDTHVGHHFIPAGTTAMVNMWAIAHDGGIWSDPESFKPERFLSEENMAIMGSDLRLSPFGSGRRVCPGKNMGLATVQLWLAQLLQSFEWIGSDDEVDLTECLKLSMEMKKQLVCKALPRNTV